MTYEEVLQRLRKIASQLNEDEEKVQLWNELVACIADLEKIGEQLNYELNKIRKAIEEQL